VFVSRFVLGDSILVDNAEDSQDGAADVFGRKGRLVRLDASGLDRHKARSYTSEVCDKDESESSRIPAGLLDPYESSRSAPEAVPPTPTD